jgi:hypothetical protein
VTETTRRLKLRIPSGTSQDSRYNLQRIDDFAGAYSLSDTGDLTIAVRGDLILLPNAASAGGSGNSTPGTLHFGTSESNVNVTFYTSSLNFEKPLSLKDQAENGTKYLNVQYKSDTSGALDTTADRTLSLDLQGSNRSIVLGGDIATAGSLTTSGSYSATFTFTAATSITFPVSGLLLTDDSIATLSNKTISGTSNTLTDISLTSSVTGILPIANGGTAASTSQGARTNLLPSQAGNSGKILQTNGTDVSWASPAAGQVETYQDTWSGSTSKIVTHNIGTEAVNVIVRDENNDIIFVEVSVDSGTQVTLTSSEVPAGTWNILVQGTP